MKHVGFHVKLVFLLSGLLIWVLHFLFVYGLNGLACARGFGGNIAWGVGVVPLVVVAATVIAVLLEVWVLAVAFAGGGPGINGEADRSVREFWRFTTATIAGLSLIAVVWTGLPAFFIDPCT
jgi:hypothetical protein